jgi:hypothetical protein
MLLLMPPVLAQEVETKEWDQAEVSRLAHALTDQVRKIRNAFRSNPTAGNLANMNQRASEEFSDSLRMIERSARQLAGRVDEGKGREETRSIARKIGTLLRDANEEGRHIMSDAWTEEQILPAQRLVDEIAPFYGAAPLYDVDSAG